MCGRDKKIAEKAKAKVLAERIKASIECGLDEETICKAFGITPEELRKHSGK